MAPGPSGWLRSENIEFDGSIQVQFEFLSVLIGGDLRQPRRIIRRADLLECFRVHRDPHDDGGWPEAAVRCVSRLAWQGQFAKFRIGNPAAE